MRRQWTWTDLQDLRLKAVCKVIEDLRTYWPLTIRQIHYQLFANQVEWGGRRGSSTYPNTKSGQQDLIAVAKYGRYDGQISWDAIEDRTRTAYRPYKFEDVQEYLKNELYYLLKDYTRCRVQDQDYYIEVWVEKDALFKIFKKVARPYCIPVVACRGYDSVTYLNSFANNARDALYRGQTPVVLYFGDLDPSGVNMFEASIETLCSEDELCLDEDKIIFHRAAITPKVVEIFGLPNDPDAGKYKDTRYKKYVERYGRLFVELDSLRPDVLEDMIRTSIERYLDLKKYQEQVEIERKEQGRLTRIRQRVVDVFNEELGTQFSI
jgi:hypothetical protein